MVINQKLDKFELVLFEDYEFHPHRDSYSYPRLALLVASCRMSQLSAWIFEASCNEISIVRLPHWLQNLVSTTYKHGF
jgi:hypothetical protein